MRYYSDICNKFFDKEKDLLKAEEDFLKLKKEKEEKKSKEKQELVADKKLMAKAVEDADAEIDAAQEQYADAIKQAREIIEKANKEAEAITSPAKEKLKNARQKRYNAISAFNKKYGPYSVMYSGDRAYAEFKRNLDFIDEFFTGLF